MGAEDARAVVVVAVVVGGDKAKGRATLLHAFI